MTVTQIVTGPLIGIAQGILLILFRKKLSSALERAYEKAPTNKISRQFYNMSYKVNPVYIAILGIIFIAVSVIAMFQ